MHRRALSTSASASALVALGVLFSGSARAEDAPASGEAKVVVELRANDPRATLERRQGTTALGGLGLPDLALGGLTHWEAACVAPCAAPVHAHSTYRIAGEGLVPTPTFALPRTTAGAPGAPLRIDADLGSSTARLSGMVLTAGGAGAMLLGATALVVSPILSANDVGSQGFRTGVVAGGAGALGLGVLLAAVGVTLWVTNGSSLRFEPAPTLASRVRRPDLGPRAQVRLLPNGLTF